MFHVEHGLLQTNRLGAEEAARGEVGRAGAGCAFPYPLELAG